MKVTKASYWVHNASEKTIRLEQFGVKIHPNTSADLFSVNPKIIYRDLIKAESTPGLFSSKLAAKELIKLDGKPPIVYHEVLPKYMVSEVPLNRHKRLGVGIRKKDRDYIAEMEADFANSETEVEALRLEKQKMLQHLQGMKQTSISEDGTLFNDDMFEDGIDNI